MKPLLIYIPQNGEFFTKCINAVVTVINTATFKDAIDIMLILSVAMMGYQYVMGKKLESIKRFVLTGFFVTYALLGLKVPVAVIDMQDASGAGKALTIDNVPLGLALPSAIISGMGYGITSVFSDVFHTTDELDYTKTGMVFGARTWLAGTKANLSSSPKLAADLSSYIRQCVFSAKLLGSAQITPEELVNSTNLLKTYFDNPSPIYRVIMRNGQNLSCGEAAADIKLRLVTAAQLELARLGRVMTKGDAKRFGDILEAQHRYYMGVSEDAAETLTQNILINATRDAAADAFAFQGADAGLMNYTNTTSMQKMHIAEANSFWLASFRLPFFMTVMLMVTTCIFPLIALLSFLPLTANVYVFYLQSQAYLWSWPPMFIFIHFIVSLAAEHKFDIFGVKTGGVTFSNIDALASQNSTFAYTAGALAASVPFLAYYITKGLSSVLGNASQHFGGIAQSLSVSEAGAAAQGNISMATYSGWNMNYDNTNAHKFDTNAYHAEGRSTIQMDNGALLSTNRDGSRVGNVQPAISSAAVGVHGSDRVVDSLHKSANEHFGHATQLRTAADKHLQAGISGMKNFTESDANDYRSGSGVSNTTTASIGQDLRIMKDAVHHFNKQHDKSHQYSLEEAVTARAESDKALLGKLAKWTFGGSVDASASVRNNNSRHDSEQTFNNTSDGKAFAEAYSHMLSTARHNNLDATDSHHLSGAEQIAANFSSAHSLLEQSSSEYSHGRQLQIAASHATEHASSIDDNLNQPYHDFVVSRYGDHGEQVMLKTDSASIATQHQWANEFLDSRAGQSAISAEVKHALSETGSSLKHDYQSDAASIKHSQNIDAQYKKDINTVDKKSSTSGLIRMSTDQLSEASTAQSEHRLKPISQDGVKIEKYVAQKIKTTDIKNKEK